ncbi:peptide chain release factor N(5)-glutamine methyltransferase [Alteromonas gilva]|uniref:Release factor glutamine methyltransferase n=1 Tax=Alteromonas gilva TaxID=2987522 RepID=A0ABT5L0M2_9ALTE|nr:peptide chain release factor N(5)-glutamine methyltransferase [Alteromonas gilva]MDC8830565.1 peptide chain release factor N(5)-glutamine methyltransferase [Alteromonas gilva]
MTIAQARAWAIEKLKEGESPSVDSRVLLCHVLQCDQSYLFTWPEKRLTAPQQRELTELTYKRQQGYPVAYLVGTRSFWTLQLQVNESTLIPRPETELLVETALALPLTDNANVCDLGTGTGAIALALASEKPGWSVTGVDRVAEALSLAAQNAQLNGDLPVTWQLSNWFSGLSDTRPFDLIVTNPPYVEDNSEYLAQGDVRFEPKSALTAGADGLTDIRIIVQQAADFLANDGWLVIEHGFAQHAAIAALLTQRGFADCRGVIDLNGHLRITLAKWQKP